MIVLARIVLRLLADLAGLVVLSLRPRRSIEAENLFLRRELAQYQERAVKPRRVDAATRESLALLSWRVLGLVDTAIGVAPAIDPEGMGGSLQPRTPARGARSRRAGPSIGGRAVCDTTDPPFGSASASGCAPGRVLGGLHHEYLPAPALA